MQKKLENLLSKVKFIRDETLRKKINLLIEASRQNNVSIACQRLGVSRNFYYYWYRRLEEKGWTLEALRQQSRRPLRSPRLSEPWKVQWVLNIRKEYPNYGPKRIRAHLIREHGIIFCEGTIAKILRRAKVVKHQEKKPRKAHLKRYSLGAPGDCVQIDVKYIPYRIGPHQYYLFNAVDDCTRWRFGLVYENKGVWETEEFFRKLLKACPFKIRKIQTDNGVEFTNKFVSDTKCFKKPPKEHILDKLCREHGIEHKLIPVGECELNGKVERSHWTDEVEFLNRRKPFRSLRSLRKGYTSWIHFYNTLRIHSSLEYMTPIEMVNFKLFGLKPKGMDHQGISLWVA